MPLGGADEPIDGAVSPPAKGAVGKAGDAFKDDTSVSDDPGELSLDVAMELAATGMAAEARAVIESLSVFPVAVCDDFESTLVVFTEDDPTPD